MLRNWVTQFGFDAGDRAGDERISSKDRGKFIDQIGAYFGWTPPPGLNWTVEVTKDANGKYVMVFLRYATEDEAEKLLGTNYETTTRRCTCGSCTCDSNLKTPK